VSWKDNLQKASFRGVPFNVEGDDSAFGRRTQVHEYPQRDKPYSEDNGKKAREYSLTAFLVGADFMAARDRLLAEIEKAGPGELVHPWYGRMMVNVNGECRVQHSRAEGGYCAITLSFVEAGELAFPSAGNAPGAKTLLAADAVQASAITDFSERFSIDNLPEFAVVDASDTMEGILDSLDAALGSVGGVLADPVRILKEQIGGLLPDPPELATRLFGLFSKAGAILTSARSIGFSDFDSLNFLRAFSTLRARSAFPVSTRPASLTSTRKAIYDNRDALAALTRRALLVQASGMTAAMPLPVYDDAVTLRRELMTALDAEAVLADDANYTVLMDLRSKVHSDITARLSDTARLQTITPGEIVPALVLAYDLYEDTARESEIIARNRLRYPGFVPAEKIKVLSA